MKPVAASAPLSELARSLFANKETAREMVRQLLAGSDTVRVAGHTFRKGRSVTFMAGDK